MCVCWVGGRSFDFREERAQWRAHLASFLCGGSFAGGLVLSGMVKRAKVVDFLALRYVCMHGPQNQSTCKGGDVTGMWVSRFALLWLWLVALRGYPRFV